VHSSLDVSCILPAQPMSKNRHVVFLHGFLEAPSMWNSILGQLSKANLTLHFPKLPGHDSHTLPETWSMNAWVNDILKQLKLSEGENAFFIGHSMGGYVLSQLAMQHPEKVRGLCLFHSRAGLDSEEKRANRLRAIDAAKESQSLYVRGMITGLFDAHNREKLHAEIETQIAYAQALPLPAIEASLMVMRDRPDAVEGLQLRHFPLYYFLGENDAAVRLEDMTEELTALPGHTAHIAHQTGHMGHLESPREAGAFIQRVLKADE